MHSQSLENLRVYTPPTKHQPPSKTNKAFFRDDDWPPSSSNKALLKRPCFPEGWWHIETASRLVDWSLLQCCENKSSVRLQSRSDGLSKKQENNLLKPNKKKTRKQSFNQFDCWKFHHPLFIHFIFFRVQNPQKLRTLKFSSTNSRFKGSSRVAIDAKRRSRRKVSDAKRKAEGQASTATRAKVSLDLRSETGHRIAGSCRFGPASKPPNPGFTQYLDL